MFHVFNYLPYSQSDSQFQNLRSSPASRLRTRTAGDEKEKRMEWQIVHKSNLLGIFLPSLSLLHLEQMLLCQDSRALPDPLYTFDGFVTAWSCHHVTILTILCKMVNSNIKLTQMLFSTLYTVAFDEERCLQCDFGCYGLLFLREVHHTAKGKSQRHSTGFGNRGTFPQHGSF